MFGRIAFTLAFAMMSTAAYAEDGPADLKAAAGTAGVKEDLAGPDGCSIQLADPANWKLICVGTAAYDFNDADEIKDATRASTLDAKAALARFLKERLSTTESIEKVVNKQVAQASGQGRNVSKSSMQTQITSIKSSADAIVRGVIVIETEQLWTGTTGTVRVKVGQSQKTINVAGAFASENAGTTSPGATGTAPTVDPGPDHTTRKSDSDF